jgi:hypothetical protein
MLTVGGELLKMMTGVNMQHVPYRGTIESSPASSHSTPNATPKKSASGSPQGVRGRPKPTK